MTKPNRELLSSYLREIALTPSDINEHLELLHSIVAETNAQHIVELGTRGGKSTSALVIGAAETGGRVTSVDHGQGSEYSREPPTWNSLGQASQVITEKLGLGRYWKLVVKDDLVFAREYDDEIDVLLIDTSHSYEQTSKELEAWGNKVVAGGFIVIHDTVWFPEQNKAIWEFLDNHPFSDYVEHTNCNGLGIIVKDTGAIPKRNGKVRNKNTSSSVQRKRLERLQDAILEMRSRLSERDSTIQSLRAERSRLHDELNQVRAELSRASKNTRKAAPSNGIRKLGAVSLRILREEGMHSLLVKAFDKIGRREFRILEAPSTAEKKMLYDEFRNWSTGGTDVFRDFYESMLSVATSRGDHENHPTGKGYPPATNRVKLIAFYLPQFHPVPENDVWWGKGFTEWTNVSKAVPQFIGHYQPRLPGELGFYDLRVIDVQKRQIELARQHGIYGFCFYYYWFDDKRLLERPLNQFLSHPELDFPFCLCWANENWTRRWDGMENQILITQNYSPKWHIRFIEDIENMLRDKRYIRVDGRPLLIIYNPGKLPSAKAVLKEWRAYCRQRGIGELYVVAAQTLGFVDPRPMGFDAAVELPPHNIRLPEITNAVELLNPTFGGEIFDYRELVENQVSRNDTPHFTLFLSVMTGWDNEPRRTCHGRTFAFSTPGLYAKWLRYACERTIDRLSLEKRLVFINAWNEWAEGAYLEPDRKYGYAYLQATAAVLRSLSRNQEKERERLKRNASRPAPGKVRKRHDTAVILHMYYPELFEEIWAYLENLMGNFDLFVSIPKTVSFSDEEIYRRHRNAYVYRCENRGRDIAPFLQIFSYLYPLKYEFICKIHSKKSTHRVDGEPWRRDIYSKLLGSPDIVSKIKAALRRTDIGIVAPAGHVLPSEHYWGLGNNVNKANVRRLCERSRLYIGDLHFTFVAGSMFWFQPRALDLLSKLDIRSSDFDPELGQTDGTLAHAFERFAGLLTEQSGFTITEIDNEENIHSPRFGLGSARTYSWASATKN